MTRLRRRVAFDPQHARRLPNISFYTSSIPKFMQAKLLFGAAGLKLTDRRHSADPYHESYAGTKEELLAQAIEQLKKREDYPATLFFIEDTSIRIEALSTSQDDYPGLGAKEWFARTTFGDLDNQLKELGDRRAVVKSCVSLSVPGLDLPLFFYGETRGLVAEAPAVFDPNPFYPWLVPDNFSAWLIPEGAQKTLAEMSFEESVEHDFRVEAILALLDRLEEYATVMNMQAPMYFRPHVPSPPQTALFPLEQRPVFLVVGPTCSGKSTLGAYVQQVNDWQVVDASSVVRVMRTERRKGEMDISDFAHELLEEEGADVVARRIFEGFKDSTATGLVVTGFRAIEEIEYLREVHSPVTVISVEAPERVRFDRYLRRGTRQVFDRFEDFRAHDRRQRDLGLLDVASELADLRIDNTHDIETYYNQIAQLVGEGVVQAPGILRVRSRPKPSSSQLYRCLVVLRDAGRPLTTQEIEGAFDGTSIRYNNANKMLKRYPALAKRLEGVGMNVRYQITPQGLAFLGAVDRLSS